jgi:hypothetical protein
MKEPVMSSSTQVATWWQNEKAREFTRLECGLLGAVFASVGIGFMVTLTSLFG